MLKRILLPLEEYDYSKIAFEYGVQLATACNCELTVLSIVDLPSIEKSIGPIPLGGAYYAQREEKLRTEEERKLAKQLIQDFETLCSRKNVPYKVIFRDGNPDEIIIDESKYHDLVIIGGKTSFRYGEAEDKGLQNEIISHGISPVLITPKSYREIEKILLCYDGKNQSTKAIQRFIQFNIHRDKQVTLVTVNDDRVEGEKLLDKMSEYLTVSNVSFTRAVIDGAPHEAIPDYVQSHDIDLVVLGAYGKLGILKFFFGSTAKKLLEDNERSLFIYH